MTLSSLQQKAARLWRSIERQNRRLYSDRKECGRLLVRIRTGMQEAQGGKHRGKNGGSFVKWLEDSGFNVGTAYSYIRLAETGQWHVGEQPSRRRIQYWQTFAAKCAKADNAGKVKLLRAAVAYLKKTYDIKAKVTIA